MGTLKDRITEATRGMSRVLYNYSDSLPDSVGLSLSKEEVRDLLRLLDECSVARERHENGEESWDGDTSDDLWREQQRYASLLPHAISKHPQEVAVGLRSTHDHTRFWVAQAFHKVPRGAVLHALQDALHKEPTALNRDVLKKAILACRRKKWFPFL
jgi:hypothetical protein